jgi:hypothetical protein
VDACEVRTIVPGGFRDPRFVGAGLILWQRLDAGDVCEVFLAQRRPAGFTLPLEPLAGPNERLKHLMRPWVHDRDCTLHDRCRRRALVRNPVVIMTAGKSQPAGARAFIQKPCEVSTLLQCVAQYAA